MLLNNIDIYAVMFKDMIQHFSKDKAGLLAVALISVAFIVIRLLMPIKFNGSYIDEY